MRPTTVLLLLLSSASVALLVVLCSRAALSQDPSPIQQRIALTPTGMTVSWSTVGPLSTAPSVSYGLSAANLTTRVSGYTLHYEPASTYFHHVVLEQLQPAATYYWTVTSPPLASSSVLSFSTAPAAGASTPFTIAINGDMGLGNEDDTVAAMTAWLARIDVFWHIGDLNYADDSGLYGMTYESATEAWMERLTAIWSQRPYMLCPGNHDITCNEVLPFLCPSGQRNVTSYLQRYRMPAVESGAVNNMWYSFDYGLVHFVSVDTEVAYPGSPEGPGTYMNAGPFGDQLAWLEADLQKAAANRAQVPWIIVAGHRPYYSSSVIDTLPAAARSLFEPVFLKYGVDVVYFGHVHWYERMYAINNGSVTQQNYTDPAAPVYLVSGSAGNFEGLDKSYGITKPYTAFLDDTHYGFGLLRVLNATHLNWTFYESATLQVLDSVEIVQEKRWAKLQARVEQDELMAELAVQS